jgi:hypothetical protein
MKILRYTLLLLACSCVRMSTPEHTDASANINMNSYIDIKKEQVATNYLSSCINRCDQHTTDGMYCINKCTNELDKIFEFLEKQIINNDEAGFDETMKIWYENE